ncbi:MAG: response regulator, partial [Solirubrobacteraceae bacterium]
MTEPPPAQPAPPPPPATAELARLAGVSLRLAAAVAAIGGIAFLGWIVSVDLLKSVVPGQVTMKANTAICFLLAAGALASLSRPAGSTARRAGAAAAAVVSAIALLTLAEYVLGADLGLDQALFAEPAGAVGTAHPGRMAINTAVAFALFGAAVLSFGSRRSPAEVGAVAMGLLAILSLLGYASGITSFYGVKGVTQMAIPTALAIVLLAAGLLVLRPQRSPWLMPGLLRSPGPGGALARRVLPAGVAVFTLIGFLRWQGEQLGLYGTKTGMLVMTVAGIAGLAGLVWRFGRWLERSDVERCKMEGELRRTARYVELTTRDLVCTVDVDGYFQQLNSAWTEALGWSESELRSRPFLEFVHPDDREQTERVAAELGAGGVTVDFVNRYEAKDGSSRWFDWSAIGAPEEGLIYASARDITQRRLTEGYVEAQHEATRVLAEAATVDEALPALLRAIGGRMGWSVGAFWTSTENESVAGLRCTAFWHESENASREFAAATKTLTLTPGVGLLGRVWESRHPCWVPDLTAEANSSRSKAAESDGLHAAVLLPVMSGPTVLGVIELLSDEIRPVEPALLEILNTLSGQLAQFLARKRGEAALAEASRERQVTLDSIGEGIFSVDVEGRTTFVNRAAQELTGWSAEELLGKVQHDLIHHTHPDGSAYPREDCPIYGVLTTGEVARNDDEVFWHKDGSSFPVEYVSAPLRDERGIVGAVMAFQDVSDRKRSVEQLAQARDEALEASHMKSQFLANMSHEIRTPLNGVIGMTELLLDTSLDSEQREYARTAQSSGESLLGVINDILDFSKIEAGRLGLEDAEFDLPEAVGDVCDLLANRAHAKGLELASDVRDDVPRLVMGDQTRLRQVLTNLLSNAIKFTTEGEVVTIVSSTERHGDRAVVRFEVHDTGIGIDPAQLERLFESFSQADASTTRRFGGTGLGLAISKQLVELMGGEIGARNRPEGGSAFWFSVPFAIVSPSHRDEERTPPDVSGLRLLVVDDNETNRTIVTTLTTSWGMAPDAAESGAEALELLRSAADAGTPYEIAVLDLTMPGMDGIELARRISEDSRLSGVAMVMLASGLARRRDAEAVGIREYLTKPARRSLLYNALVSAAAARGPAEEPSAEPEPTPADPPAPDAAPILVVEDNAINQAVAEGMLTRRGHPVDIAQNGREAVEAVSGGRYGAVLMDCQMPEMDGYEATAEIRRREGEGARIPIIAMTAHSMEGDRERCLAAGMDDYLPKPLRGDALDAALGRWLPPDVGEGIPDATVEARVNGNGSMDFEMLDRLEAELGGLGRPNALDPVLRQFLESVPDRVAA